MPVIGTPVTTLLPPATPVVCPVEGAPCDEQNLLQPTASTYYDKLVLRRMRSVRAVSGQHVRIEWQLLDTAGNPIDLTACGFPVESTAAVSSSSYSSSSAADTLVGFRVRVRENLSVGISPQADVPEPPVVLVDTDLGKIQITLSSDYTNTPGVYFVEVGVFDDFDTEDERLLFSNVFYLLLDRGQFGASEQEGPPTIAEVRLHLRDSGPEDNLLLDNIKFSDEEIALAISRPLQEWNETPPDLGVRATTQNFPYRFHWLEAICGNLFLMAAENYRANNLTYSAAGVQVNDQDKEPNYERAAAQRLQNWRYWLRRKKAEINADMCYGGIGSDYRWA